MAVRYQVEHLTRNSISMRTRVLSSIYLTKTNTTSKTSHRCSQPSDIKNPVNRILDLYLYIYKFIYKLQVCMLALCESSKVLEMALLCTVKINLLIKCCLQFFLIKCRFIHLVAYYYFYQEITCTVVKSVKSKFLAALVLYL